MKLHFASNARVIEESMNAFPLDAESVRFPARFVALGTSHKYRVYMLRAAGAALGQLLSTRFQPPRQHLWKRTVILASVVAKRIPALTNTCI